VGEWWAKQRGNTGASTCRRWPPHEVTTGPHRSPPWGHRRSPPWGRRRPWQIRARCRLPRRIRSPRLCSIYIGAASPLLRCCSPSAPTLLLLCPAAAARAAAPPPPRSSSRNERRGRRRWPRAVRCVPLRRTRPGSPATLDLGVSAEPGKRRDSASHGPGCRTGQPHKHAMLHLRSAAELRGHPGKHALRDRRTHKS
jgi:hypothetical protein